MSRLWRPAAVARFGKVDLLFNNAGVFRLGCRLEDLARSSQWVIGANQNSVIHGIRSFVRA